MAEVIIVGSKLPNGLVLHHPTDPNKKVTIKGLNSSKIVGATYVTTEVDAEFWQTWKLVHKEFVPLKSGAIFEAKNEAAASSIAKERAKVKTGLEPMSRDAGGVKPATKD